ncbi:peroxisomal membrane protein PMP34 isoform X1 [Acomys russatus]|uniref:peroxisomal membrane protein PMP34 isoform X1 n=1 Tax=Acomys russatus TaxID=60746 RepID=UPI0021E2C4F7|nr:peroxisomal membrane protein PMP34 isoform X1 [Acomys russatus]
MASVLSYESLVHAVAGAVGSVTAMTVFFPLDTARLRLQVDEKRKSKTTHAVLLEIIKEEGLLAPYRGWFPVISSLCCSNFVYFYTFNSLKAVWVKGQRSSTGKDLVIGFVAGVVNVLLTTPLWVVNTRLKLQGAKFRNEDIIPTNYKGIMDAFHQIVRDEGISALWNGTFPSLLLVLNPAIQFMFYEGLKRQLLKKRMKLSSLDVFIIGAVAKAIATTVTYPMQTVQSILRTLWNRGTLQRPRSQAAPDGAHGCPHVPGVREADSCHLHRYGPEELTQALSSAHRTVRRCACCTEKRPGAPFPQAPSTPQTFLASAGKARKAKQRV